MPGANPSLDARRDKEMGFMLADQEILTTQQDLLAHAITMGILCYIENAGLSLGCRQRASARPIIWCRFWHADPDLRPLSRTRPYTAGIGLAEEIAILWTKCQQRLFKEKSHRGLVRPLGKRIRETVRGFESHLLRLEEPARRALFLAGRARRVSPLQLPAVAGWERGERRWPRQKRPACASTASCGDWTLSDRAPADRLAQ